MERGADRVDVGDYRGVAMGGGCAVVSVEGCGWGGWVSGGERGGGGSAGVGALRGSVLAAERAVIARLERLTADHPLQRDDLGFVVC